MVNPVGYAIPNIAATCEGDDMILVSNQIGTHIIYIYIYVYVVI